MAKIRISSTRCYGTIINELGNAWCQELELYSRIVRKILKST